VEEQIMRHTTAGNIATFALSIPLIQSRLLAGRRVMRLALAAVLLLLGAALPLAAQGTSRNTDSKNLGGRGPGDMAIVRLGMTTYIFMSNFDNKEIVTYRLEAGNTLTEVGRTPTCDEPRQLDVTLNGRWLLVACSSEGSLRVYRVVSNLPQGSAGVTKRSALAVTLESIGATRTGGQPFAVEVGDFDWFFNGVPGYPVTVAIRDTGTVAQFFLSDSTEPGFERGKVYPLDAQAVRFGPHVVETIRILAEATFSRSPNNSKSAAGIKSVSNDLALVAVANSESNDLTIFKLDTEGKLRLITISVPVGGSPRALAFDPSGRRLFVAVRSTPPAEDQIRTYKVSPGGELTFVGTTPGGRFLTDIEATSDRVFVVTVNNQTRDEIRTYRRRGNELILDTALATPGQPGQPPSFKQITVAPGQGPLTNVFVTEYQAGFLRSVEYTRDNQVACAADAENLCLNGVEVQVDFLASGNRGFGQAARLTDDTGAFTFFNRENIELVPKVLDGRGINGSLWAFYGALSNVAYRLRMTDTRSGRMKEYDNPAGNLASFADTNAFPAASVGSGMEAEAAAGAASETEIAEMKARTQEELYALLTAQQPAQAPLDVAACATGGTKLCLSQGRFEVRVDWSVPSQGRSGMGTAVPVTSDTGYFTFFDAANVELIIKVLDARVLNGKFWLFYGALSNVEYTITVTDTETGQVKTYFNPSGTLASVADTAAF